MKRLILITLALAATVTAALARTPAEVPNVHLANRNRYVSDPDNMLSAAAVARTDSLLGDIWQRTTAEPVLVVVGDLSDTDADTYATELFELWGLGKKDRDNGLLILISRDDRRAVIRTGYGVEPILNDARCGRIIREIMAPEFKKGNYDKGVTDAAAVINSTMTHPDAADELISKYANNADADDDGDLFTAYLILCLAVACGMCLLLLYKVIAGRKRPRYERYGAVDSLSITYLVLSFMTLGMGLVPYLILLLTRRAIRERACKCPNCGHKMERLDEQADNAHLTPAQDMEERLNSVDYDVWVCPQCHEEDILPYINKQKNYKVCERCGSRSAFLESDRILTRPTTERQGNGVKTYRCLNCGQRYSKMYDIAKLASASVAPIIIGGGGGFGGGGGGGFSGGSFGGGMTGGGGASGGW